MRKSRSTESQIVAILKKGDASASVAEIARKHGIRPPRTFLPRNNPTRESSFNAAAAAPAAAVHDFERSVTLE